MDTKLTDKIAALLRMAEHPNSNENEAAIAMQKAQRLLLDNNLARADIRTGPEEATPAGAGKLDVTEASGFAWKARLAFTLAGGNLCQTVTSTYNNTFHVFGTYDNVKGVMEMYHWLVPEFENMALRRWAEYKRDGTGRERSDVWRRGFYAGATDTIAYRLRDTLRDFTANTGHALVPMNAALVKDAVKRVFPRLRPIHSSNNSRDGRAAGRQAGEGLSLRPQRKLGPVALPVGR